MTAIGLLSTITLRDDVIVSYGTRGCLNITAVAGSNPTRSVHEIVLTAHNAFIRKMWLKVVTFFLSFSPFPPFFSLFFLFFLPPSPPFSPLLPPLHPAECSHQHSSTLLPNSNAPIFPSWTFDQWEMRVVEVAFGRSRQLSALRDFSQCESAVLRVCCNLRQPERKYLFSFCIGEYVHVYHSTGWGMYNRCR